MTDLFAVSQSCLKCLHWKPGSAYPVGRFCSNPKSVEFLRATKSFEGCDKWEEK